MTEQEAIKLIAEYDNAVGDCEKRPRSKAAGKRFQEVFKRVIAAMVREENPGREREISGPRNVNRDS